MSRGPLEASSLPTDESPLDEGPDLEIFFGGNLDWYVQVRGEKSPLGRSLSDAVRFSTSGGRNDVATLLVAALDAAALHEWDKVASRCEAAISQARSRKAEES